MPSQAPDQKLFLTTRLLQTFIDDLGWKKREIERWEKDETERKNIWQKASDVWPQKLKVLLDMGVIQGKDWNETFVQEG